MSDIQLPAEPPVRRAGEDPRVGRTRQAVHTATLDVLASRGFARFSMEAVSAEARVSKSTIYRYWPTKIDLIADAMRSLNRQPAGRQLAGGAREQVERLLGHLVDAMSDSVLSDCLPALIEAAEHHEEVADLLHTYSDQRRQTLVDVLAAGIASGELPGHLDPELAALALSGPIFYCRTMTGRPFPRDQVAALVAQVLGPGTVYLRPG